MASPEACTIRGSEWRSAALHAIAPLFVRRRLLRTDIPIKRRGSVCFASIALVVIIVTFWLKSAREKSADAVRVQFIGMTNNPSLGPVAILCVTNQAVGVIVCGMGASQVHSSSGWIAVGDRSPSGLAYLERGESYVFAVPVPKGAGPWRVPVSWQRQNLSRLEGFINLQHRRLLVFLGEPNGHRDAWVPFNHIIHSPEIGR